MSYSRKPEELLAAAVEEIKHKIDGLQEIMLNCIRPPQPDVKAGQLWRHVKTGTVYKVADICIIEKTLDAGVLYHAHSNDRVQMLNYMRPKNEFTDGRFILIGYAGKGAP